MRAKYKLNYDQTEGYLGGMKLYERRIERLLARREDLTFNWRQDLMKLLWDVDKEWTVIENQELKDES